MTLSDAVALVLVLAASVVIVALIRDRTSGEAYHRAYRRAEREDLAYYQAHPGCSYEEAHRSRDRVNRRFGR